LVVWHVVFGAFENIKFYILEVINFGMKLSRAEKWVAGSIVGATICLGTTIYGCITSYLGNPELNRYSQEVVRVQHLKNRITQNERHSLGYSGVEIREIRKEIKGLLSDSGIDREYQMMRNRQTRGVSSSVLGCFGLVPVFGSLFWFGGEAGKNYRNRERQREANLGV
jgi:hypothetical protein